jgi:hypothetical protein
MSVFDHRPVYVRFVVDKVALGQAFLRVPRLSPSSIILPTLHTHNHLHLQIALTRRTNGRSLGNLPKITALSEIGEHWIEKYFLSFFSVFKTGLLDLLCGAGNLGKLLF